MGNNLTIKDRILTFIEVLGIKKSEFFDATGIQPSNFKGKNMTSQPGGAALVKILTVYPDLSAEWLMRGNGEMLRKSHDSAECSENPNCLSDYSSTVQNSGKSCSNGVQSPFEEVLRPLLNKIADQAEEIGRLKQRADDAEQRLAAFVEAADEEQNARVG